MQTIIAAQMSGRLPVLIDPLRFAQKAMRIKGFLRVADFERLVGQLANTEGEIEVHLEFDYQQGKPVVDGQIKGSVNLVCERCLQALAFTVDKDVHLGLIEDESQADALLPGYEPMLCGDEPMKLASIIEDEILLMLPMVPKHDKSLCQSGYEVSDEDLIEDESEQDEARKNPFAALEKLKLH